MATHSSVLARTVPWTEGPGGLQSVGSQRVTQRDSLHSSERSTRVSGSGRIRFRFCFSPFSWGGCCLVSKLCPTLREPTCSNPPSSSVHGILQARILEWVAVPSSRGSSRPREDPVSPMFAALSGGFFTTSAILRGVANYLLLLRPCKCFPVHRVSGLLQG